VEDDFIALLGRKLDESLSAVDLRVGDRFLVIYAQITPASSCPFCSAVMEEIKGICAAGVKERGEVAKDVVLGLLDTIPIYISSELTDKILLCVQQRMPEDKFVVQAANIKDVYERRSSGVGKFQERPFDIEMSAIRCGSANLSRRALGCIKTTLEDRLLKSRVDAQMAEPLISPQPAVPELRKRTPWTRDHRLSLMNIVVALAIAVLTIAAGCYTQEIKGFLHTFGG